MRPGSVPERPGAVLVAARRTAVAPRGGALAAFQADELAAPVLARLLQDAGLRTVDVDQVVLGNALYAGGNPARMAALRAGLPVECPAMSLDTQCCSGLDAILAGARLIEAGAADCVLAGGTESFSRAPIRMHRPQGADDSPEAYQRPAFAPPPFEDPDLTETAARLAEKRGITREAQADYAVRSHHKARAAREGLAARLVTGTDGSDRPWPDHDSFARDLTVPTALRAGILAGTANTGLSAATIACEADGAATVLLLNEARARDLGLAGLKVLGGVSLGSAPEAAPLAPISAAAKLLQALGLTTADITAVELMEAYAVQAMATCADLGLEAARLNGLGGALARGHPIGASGAILAVHLFERWRTLKSAGNAAEFRGLALIAAAGGLGTALAFQGFPVSEDHAG